jgi:hypothetical protein
VLQFILKVNFKFKANPTPLMPVNDNEKEKTTNITREKTEEKTCMTRTKRILCAGIWAVITVISLVLIVAMSTTQNIRKWN